jgi:CopG family nickel-responsive transcriptional regulator
MAELSRTGVSIDTALLQEFDRFIANKGYTNRSEALRDLIRDHLVTTSVLAADAEVVGTVTLIYDHHRRLLPDKLTDIQHEHHAEIISTVKGVQRGRLVMISPAIAHSSGKLKQKQRNSRR